MIGKTNAVAGGKSNGQYNIETIYNDDGTQTLSITDWDYKPAPKYDRILANNTPAQINMVCEEIATNGYTSSKVVEIYGWNIGDTITIPLSTGENIEVRISGFNHDILSSDHTSKAGITFEMTHCLATPYPVSTEATNAGGYPSTTMKLSTLPTIKALLPKEWQDIIKFVDKKSANGGSTNYTETLTTSEDLFLLSQIEITGTAEQAQNGQDEGTQYEYYKISPTDAIIKMYDTDGDAIVETVNSWWLRSCYNGNTNGMCRISKFGGYAYSKVTTSYGLSFAFCV